MCATEQGLSSKGSGLRGRTMTHCREAPECWTLISELEGGRRGGVGSGGTREGQGEKGEEVGEESKK